MARKELTPEEKQRRKERREARKAKKREQKEMGEKVSVEGSPKELARRAIELAMESKIPKTPMVSVKTPVGKKKIPAYFPIPMFDHPEHYIQTQKILKSVGYGVRSNGFFVQPGFDSKDLPQAEFIPIEPEPEKQKPEK